MKYKDKREYQINVLADTIKIMEQFLYDNPELGITELSEKTGLHKNKVFRILATLESYGYIEQNPETQLYRLGIKVLQLGQSYLQKSGLAVISEPLLSELNSETGETALLVVFSGLDPVCISVKESIHKLKVTASPGERYPLHATAAGKILLYSYYDQNGGLPQLGELKKFTEKTIIDKNKLLEEIKIIEEKNYAFEREEWQEGVIGIASPVRDFTSKVVAGIGLFIPVNRFKENEKEKLIKSVVRKSWQLSFKIGYPYLPPEYS